MSAQTKISIVTVSFNSEKTIKRTIESVVEQNYDNLEYWIIDGCSTDSTMDVVKSYAEKYPFINYISEADDGIADAFNKGIKLSSGELIGLINSDDILLKNALKTVNKAFLDSDSDVIYGDSIVDDESNGLLIYKSAGTLSQLKYEMPFIHQSCFIKKEKYLECGLYSTEYKICMDYDMLKRIYNSSASFAYVNRPLALFQYGGGIL